MLRRLNKLETIPIDIASAIAFTTTCPKVAILRPPRRPCGVYYWRVTTSAQTTNRKPPPNGGQAGLPLPEKACYQAMVARDAQFDGQFIVGVTSTHIYCRPVCKVRLPKPENCRFFVDAIQAQLHGFRPCRRCRPELAPQGYRWSLQDLSASLAVEALRLLDQSCLGVSGTAKVGSPVQHVAKTLGISARHLQRIVQQQYGYSPLAYVQQQRLLHARQMLADTPLTVQQIAKASGYNSVRAFHTAFAKYDGRAPLALRQAQRALQPTLPVHDEQTPVMRLAFRPPYQIAELLRFLRQRAIPGVEWVAAGEEAPRPWHWVRTLALEGKVLQGNGLQGDGKQGQGAAAKGWVAARLDAQHNRLDVALSAALLPYLPTIKPWLAAQFDLNAAPHAIAKVLAPDFADSAGLRVAGCMQPFELVVRAVLGQQLSVRASGTQLHRFAMAFGTPIVTPFAGVHLAFPTAAEFLAHGLDAAERMGQLGVFRSRQTAIIACAQALASGRLVLDPGAPVQPALTTLCNLPGIGPWTAQYIVMRTIKWPDAFLEGDAALHKALGVKSAAAAARRALPWQPWRSYAVVAAWRLLEGSPLSKSINPAKSEA